MLLFFRSDGAAGCPHADPRGIEPPSFFLGDAQTVRSEAEAFAHAVLEIVEVIDLPAFLEGRFRVHHFHTPFWGLRGWRQVPIVNNYE